MRLIKEFYKLYLNKHTQSFMRFSFLCLAFTILFYSIHVQSQVVALLPDAKEISYSGRVDFSNPKKPTFCYSGVSIQTTFVGIDISMVLKDYGQGGDAHTNYYAVLLDGKLHKVIEALPGKHTYELATKLPNEKHTIEIFKRTECSVGSSEFLGFNASSGTVFEKPASKKNRIEFIGDSFTCGYGNEVSIAAPPAGNPNIGFHSKNEDHYMSYSAQTARALDAEYRCVAYSGRGMYRNNSGNQNGTIPKIYERIFPDDYYSVSWDAKKEIPDVIVVFLGINDFAPESSGDELNDDLYTKTYVHFVEKLRSHYRLAKIVCISGVGLSDMWPDGRKCLTRFNNCIQQVVESRNSAGDNKVFQINISVPTSHYGEDWHPTIASHTKMAEQLTPFIEKILNE